jgi:predicted RNase H-like nuclease (RuvC/YqgF family)
MSDTHEFRELRFKVKTLSRCCGRQGDTIHHLRAELAEVREIQSKIDRGDIRRLERENGLLGDHLREVLEENARLRDKLNFRQEVPAGEGNE